MKIIGNQKGVAALLTIVIIAASALIMAYTASFLGLGELDLGYTFQAGGEAFSMADGCVEETLRRIALDNNYGLGMGLINLTVTNGSCIINVTEPANGQRIVIVTGLSNEYYQKIEVNLTLLAGIPYIDSWEQSSD